MKEHLYDGLDKTGNSNYIMKITGINGMNNNAEESADYIRKGNEIYFQYTNKDGYNGTPCIELWKEYYYEEETSE